MKKIRKRRSGRIVSTLAVVPLLLVAEACSSASPPAPNPSPTRDYTTTAPQERSGVLPNGAAYQISVPAGWNGTVINDLDAVDNIRGKGPQSKFFLEHGYAYSGTSRPPDRDVNYDPHVERDNQVKVLDIFEAAFGAPKHTIQFGCSGGGGVALAVAEAYPDRVDGAISVSGAEPVVKSNQRLDLLFALKALLAPDSDLPIVGISFEDRVKAQTAWRSVLEPAQQNDAGRAHIALAGTLAQAPTWGGVYSPYLEKPNPNDPGSVQQAMVRSVVDAAVYSAGIRYLYDNPAGVMSWNNGIDYNKFYANADEGQKKIISDLYVRAGLDAQSDVGADLARINAYPRIEATADSVNYWRERALTGNPAVPVLQTNTVGDSTRSAALLAGYAEGVQKNGKTDLYRQALMDAAGHCTYNQAEVGALVETMVRRLETGKWDESTRPDQLNTIGRSFGLDEPRFISADSLPTRNNRAFFPSR